MGYGVSLVLLRLSACSSLVVVHRRGKSIEDSAPPGRLHVDSWRGLRGGTLSFIVITHTYSRRGPGSLMVEAGYCIGNRGFHHATKRGARLIWFPGRAGRLHIRVFGIIYHVLRITERLLGEVCLSGCLPLVMVEEFGCWWARGDLNPRPPGYEPGALPG